MSDYIPQEVMIKILKRLPAKSLMKFRCVSKSWDSLITSPYFISLHTRHSLLSKPITPPTNQIIMRRYSKPHNNEIYSVHIDNPDSFPEEGRIRIENPFRDIVRFYCRIVGCCNGVFCLSEDLFGPMDIIYLWNPLVKRKLTLPMPQAVHDNLGYLVYVLGFGFDVQNKEHKVVRIAYVEEDDYSYVMPPIVEVYAPSIGSWHKVEGEIPHNCVAEYFWSQVFFNGSVHWVAYKNKGRHVKAESLIMLFDISREVFSEMQVPQALFYEMPINLNIAIVEESIAIFQYGERVFSNNCNIWVMETYGIMESWSKKYCVNLDGELGIILGFRTNGDVLLTKRNNGVPDSPNPVTVAGLVSHNPVTGANVDLGIIGTKDSFYVGTYSESLILLAEGNRARERVPSDSESDSDCDSDSDGEPPIEYDEFDDDVEKSEHRNQTTAYQCQTALYMSTLM